MTESAKAIRISMRAFAVSVSTLLFVAFWFFSAQGVSKSDAASTTIVFCVNKKTFVVTQKAKCSSAETPIKVNQQGVPGIQGPAGQDAVPNVMRGNPTATEAGGSELTVVAFLPLHDWTLPSTNTYLVTQQIVVNAFPTNRQDPVYVECFIGDRSKYSSSVTITAIPNRDLPEGHTTFNTGYANITYLTQGEPAYSTFCQSKSETAQVFAAGYPISVMAVKP